MEWKIYEVISRLKVEWNQSRTGKEIDWKERESIDISKWL